MNYKDNIYGNIKIKEPVLLELLNSPSVLRLKKISQFGIPDKYYHFKNFTRFEHSVGVMIILRKLGANLEEQVAGLLHDVSVLAFSHIADWVFSEGRKGIEDFHDKIHADFVKKTELPKVLEKFNFSLKRILNEENFTLLERKIPDLCADRIDYALREFQYWLNPRIVQPCFKSLVNFNGEIVFNDLENAFDFGKNFLGIQINHWGSPKTMIRYHLFSKALKIALEKGTISTKDFYRDEDSILRKIESCQNKSIKEIMDLLEKKELKYLNLGKKIVKKFRYVDPKVILKGKLVKLSEIKPEFQLMIEKQRKINKKGLFV